MRLKKQSHSDVYKGGPSVTVAFLFPGQGAQAVGMGKAVCDSHPEARSLFDQASDVLGRDLYQLCVEGPAVDLNSTVWSQPALYVASFAGLKQLESEQPDVFRNATATAGLSLGEYTALAFAGVFDFESGLKLVAARGRAMQQASDLVNSGIVSVLGLDEDKLNLLCNQCREGDVLQIANSLCPGNTAISGHNQALARLTKAAEDAGAMRVVPLPVSGAFHTELMRPAVAGLEEALAATEFHKPRINVIMNVDAKPHDDPTTIREMLARQIVSPVMWEASLRYLIDVSKVERAFEIGPGRVLRGTLKRIVRKFPCDSIEV